MWDGGCDGGRGYAIHDQTLAECNTHCNKLSWCTQMAFHQEDGTCYVNSKDCTKAGASGYKNYRPVGNILDLVNDNSKAAERMFHTNHRAIQALTHPEPEFMHNGGCDGGRGHAIYDQTLHECNAACNKLNWCTQI